MKINGILCIDDSGDGGRRRRRNEVANGGEVNGLCTDDGGEVKAGRMVEK